MVSRAKNWMKIKEIRNTRATEYRWWLKRRWTDNKRNQTKSLCDWMCPESKPQGYTTLFRQTLFRQTLFRQSTVWTTTTTTHKFYWNGSINNAEYNGSRVADFSWIGLRAVPIGKMPNQIPKIRGLFEPNIWSGISKFWYESLKSQTQYAWGSNCLGASIYAVLSMHATPRPPPMFFSNFYYFYICLSVLKMYWVVVTADCRNSVCRNRVCRNSVCLPNHRTKQTSDVSLSLAKSWTMMTV